MNKAFIWDLDGTLLDSYDIIVSSLYETYKEQGIDTNKDDILKHAVKYSVSSFIQSMEEKTGLEFDKMKKRYSEISGEKKLHIKLIPNAKEILEHLSQQGVQNFVFTHRGKTTQAVLKNLGISDFFREVITSQEDFPRKPAADAINYLIEKYNLDPASTFYVGDRSLDMECARNAGIRGILFLPKSSVGKSTGIEDFVVEDLLEIKEI